MRATRGGYLARASDGSQVIPAETGGLLEARRGQGKGDTPGSPSARLGAQHSGTNVT